MPDEAHDLIAALRFHKHPLAEQAAKRIADLEAALDEIRGAAFEMSRSAQGTVQTMCVPIGAWENAMRFIETQAAEWRPGDPVLADDGMPF